MKRIIFTIICIVSLFLNVSCGGKLNGTYQLKDSDIPTWGMPVTSLYFQGNKVTVEDLHMPVKCDYRITDGTIFITGTATILGTPMMVDYEYTFEQKDGSIFLDGYEFVKVD